ncbi:MAG: hypothetical protein K8S98_03410 [Planctomycetes bacterium]|nr:hypothetical protein [Planctomycetota bacterium]
MPANLIRLIVEDGGRRRSFQVTPGLLSIGSGVQAQLKLGGPLIAEEHGELDIGSDGALLRIRPGAQLAMIDGKPQRGEVAIAPNSTFVLGSATLTLRYEKAVEPELAPPTPPPAPPPKRTAAARQAQKRKNADIVGRTKTRNVGTFIAVGIMLLSGAGSAYILLDRKAPAREAVEGRGEARLAKAREHRDHALWDLLDADLAALPKDFAAEPNVKAEVTALRAELANGRALQADLRLDEEASVWLKNQVESFAARYLLSPMDPGAPRAYVRRLEQFLHHWPNHSKAEWARTERARFASVDLAEPATWEETKFDVRVLTRQPACPEYADAFALLDDFAKRATDEESAELDALVDQLKSERLAWTLARLEQAKRDQDNGQLSVAFEWLVNIGVYCGDPALEKVAAARILGFPDLLSRMMGYETYRPLTWERLMAQPDLAAWSKAR